MRFAPRAQHVIAEERDQLARRAELLLHVTLDELHGGGDPLEGRRHGGGLEGAAAKLLLLAIRTGCLGGRSAFHEGDRRCIIGPKLAPTLPGVKAAKRLQKVL